MEEATISVRLEKLAIYWLQVPLLIAVFCTPSKSRVLAAEKQSFAAWKQQLRADAIIFGIRPSVFDRATNDVRPNYKLPDLVRSPSQKRRPKGQAEFVRPPQAYLSKKLLTNLAQRGRQLLSRHAAALGQIEREIGVAPAAVLAIWGRETAFGGYRLRHNAIRTLVTQAYAGRRSRVFRRELFHALQLIQSGIANDQRLRSSWAGAIGLTQFMPSEYDSLAYDLNRDGFKDIWSPEEALASAANQLRSKGWQSGKTWGFEVTLSNQVTCAMDGPRDARTIRDWQKLGVSRTGSRQFPKRYSDEVAFLFTPGGGLGPAFLVLENFMVFKRYNPSDLYALFVGHLADRILGGGDFVSDWSSIRQLPTAEIESIQSHLKAEGFNISKVDGKVGANTRSQIGRYQRRHGLKIDCWPSARLLQHMRG